MLLCVSVGFHQCQNVNLSIENRLAWHKLGYSVIIPPFPYYHRPIYIYNNTIAVTNFRGCLHSYHVVVVYIIIKKTHRQKISMSPVCVVSLCTHPPGANWSAWRLTADAMRGIFLRHLCVRRRK